MKSFRTLVALPFFTLPLLLSPAHAGDGDNAAATAPDIDQASGDQAAKFPSVPLTPALLYHFLLAEIAGQRGQMGMSASIYRDLARETRDPRVVRRAAELALHTRQLEPALELTRLWQQVEPDSPQADQTAIRLLGALGRQNELAQEVAAHLAAEPQHLAQNLSHLNRLFVRSTDRQLVRRVVDSVTAPYLAHAEAHYARALAAFEANAPADARSAISRALEIKPDWETAALFQVQLTEAPAAAMDLLGRFVAAYPQARSARLAYARGLVTLKRFAEARREFEVLLEPSPNAAATAAADAAGQGLPRRAAEPVVQGEVVFAIALLSLQMNDPQAAEKHLRRLIDIGHGESDKARFYLGQIAEEAARWEEARQWFGEITAGEHYLPARLHAANTFAKQGQLAAARRHLVESRADDSRDRAQLIVGEAQLLREAGQVAEAHGILVAGLKQHPDQPELLYETALLAEKLGRHDELESHLRRLIELRPDHAHALNALGYSFADRRHNLGEAQQLIERALELSPNDPFILDSKGWVQFRRGELAAALDTINRAFALRPDPEIAAHLGEVLWSLGRHDEARSTWHKAREAHPANEVLAETVKRLQP